MSVLALVPIQVTRRRRAAAAEHKKKAQLHKVDRVLAVLSRFVAHCARVHRFRKVFPLETEAWSNIMEREDNRVASEHAARIRNLVVMPEDLLNAHFRQQIAEVRDIGKIWEFIVFIRAKRAQRAAEIEEGRQIWRELNFSSIGLSVRGYAAHTAAFTVGSAVIQPVRALAEWVPMSFSAIAAPVRLHNAMRAAPVRRVTGRFSALDSDDE
jgi:hypothetical protein